LVFSSSCNTSNARAFFCSLLTPFEFGIVQVAEHDRLRRAGLLAGGDDIAVDDFLALARLPVTVPWMRCTQ
jgi:hypothetical protein